MDQVIITNGKGHRELIGKIYAENEETILMKVIGYGLIEIPFEKIVEIN